MIICQGWLDCHGASELLAVRLASFRSDLPEEFDSSPSGADVYSDGREAMEFGVRDIEDPSDGARELIRILNEMSRMREAKKAPKSQKKK